MGSIDRLLKPLTEHIFEPATVSRLRADIKDFEVTCGIRRS